MLGLHVLIFKPRFGSGHDMRSPSNDITKRSPGCWKKMLKVKKLRIKNIEDLILVVISYEIYETSLRRVS